MPSTLLKKSVVKRRIMEVAAATQNTQGYTRVSEETFVHLEEKIDELIINLVGSQDGNGKTVHPRY